MWLPVGMEGDDAPRLDRSDARADRGISARQIEQVHFRGAEGQARRVNQPCVDPQFSCGGDNLVDPNLHGERDRRRIQRPRESLGDAHLAAIATAVIFRDQPLTSIGASSIQSPGVRPAFSAA